MKINNNTTSFNAWTNYTQNTTNLQLTMDRISNGVKGIQDDPAAVALSERMRAQADGTANAQTNVKNGMSMISTADTWLQKISDSLKSMTALAVSANDATKTSIDRTNAQTEFSNMQKEIVRITSGTTAAGKYNGKSLFQTNNDFNIQVGADQGQVIGISFKDLTSTSSSTFSTTDGTAVDWKSIVNGGTSGMSIGSGVDSTKMATNLRDLAGAVDFIANIRANSGSQTKRLKMTGEALATYEGNLRASESSIRDVDVAQESTKLANYQIKLNASSAMLAQANQLPSSVLQLLG